MKNGEKRKRRRYGDHRKVGRRWKQERSSGSVGERGERRKAAEEGRGESQTELSILPAGGGREKKGPRTEEKGTDGRKE